MSKIFNRSIVHVLALVALALTSGCGAFSVTHKPDFKPESRYGSDAVRVKVKQDKNGKFYLTTMDDDAIRRPWRAVGTFKALGPYFTSWEGAAREMGCDAFWIANEYEQGDGYSITTTTTGTVDEVKISYGDELCIQFTDDKAKKAKNDEIDWVWTAYQRPPMNGGWNLAANMSLNRAPSGAGSWVGFTLQLEKYLRHIPLGFAGRIGGDAQGDYTWYSAGAMVLVPAITLWRLQLTGAAGATYGVGNNSSDNPQETALTLVAGGYADLVLARWVALGAGLEYYVPMSDVAGAPSGPNYFVRYGFAF